MENPRVKFQVLVGPEGEIADYIAVEATHFGLLEKAEKKIQDAEFEPATENGTPTVGKISVYVNFFDPEQRVWSRGGSIQPLGMNVSEALDRKLYDLRKAKYLYAESEASDLDEPPKLIETKMFVFHAPDEPAPVGRVLVQYYIDFEGHVHLPRILESDDDYLSLSVLETLKNTRFAPPLKNGSPTFVSVRQPFNFGNKAGKP